MNSSNDFPTLLTILGATGDLMTKKIIPALFLLFQQNYLPKKFKIIGFSRRDLTEQSFKGHIDEIIKSAYPASEEVERALFLGYFLFQRGNFDVSEDFSYLKNVLAAIDVEWGMCANKLFYLAVHPNHFKTIFQNMAAGGLTEKCGPDEGWLRVMIEKPFGENLATAHRLDELMRTYFLESQIYRIDHYPAKDILQNILTFRFSNNLFEQSWSNEHIESVHITLFETVGVEKRGAFYDAVGALRDMGQNHILQILALIAMEHPGATTADAIRTERTRILQKLRVPSQREIAWHTFRAQYDEYRTIEHVGAESDTETYFRARAFLDTPRWSGVPFILQSGKRMHEVRKEIIISFRHPSPCLCPKGTREHLKNKIVFTLEPEEKIAVHLWSKKPGFSYDVEERIIIFPYRLSEFALQYAGNYAKLLYDAFLGDQTLFTGTEEVRATWRFIDPIIEAWKRNVCPLAAYPPDTHGAVELAEKNESDIHEQKLKRELAVLGLGKMGGNIAWRMAEKGWKVVGWNRTREVTDVLSREGITPAYSVREALALLVPPRVVWVMLPAGAATEDILFGPEGVVEHLSSDDIIIDGGNSLYKESRARFEKCAARGIHFLDCGTSGGPGGARNGPCLMVGGAREAFERIEYLFSELALPGGYQFFLGAGAGHFVKMIHNGIEYGMMQALAEGFDILKSSTYSLDLSRVVDIYNHGSVIESRLVGWLGDAFREYGTDLEPVSGSVAHTGEGAWTVSAAREQNIPARIIEGALQFRIESENHPSYTGKILSALRGQFGKHAVFFDKNKKE